MKKILIITISFLITIQGIPADNPDSSDCLELIKKVYGKLTESVKPTSEKITHMNYTQTIKLNDNIGGENYSSEVDLYTNKEKSYLISKEIEVYQDQQSSVSIIPNRRMIYISDYDGSESKKETIEHLAFLQDTLFSLCNVLECKDIDQNNSTLKFIKLGVSGQGQQLFKIMFLTFYVNMENNSLESIKLEYTPNNKISYMNVTINLFDEDCKTDYLNTPVLSIVLQNNGMLLPAYQDYKLLDKRIKNEN
jgi:hypothetical protein